MGARLVCWLVTTPIAIFALPYFVDEAVRTWIGAFGVFSPLILFFSFILLNDVQKRMKKKKEPKEKANTSEVEDQLKELKEQLATGAIAREEYEQKKRKLLEKS